MSSTRRWRLKMAATAIVFLASSAYFGLYCHLRSRGLAEGKAFEMDGFLYVPLAEVVQTHDLSRHYFRMTLFGPINWLDQRLGGPSPIRGIMFDLQ